MSWTKNTPGRDSGPPGFSKIIRSLSIMLRDFKKRGRRQVARPPTAALPKEPWAGIQRRSFVPQDNRSIKA